MRSSSVCCGETRIAMMNICGESEPGDLKLEMTTDGKDEVRKRMNKMLNILAEVSLNDVKEPMRFLRGADEDVKVLVGVPIRSHILGEMRVFLDEMFRKNEKLVSVMAANLSSEIHTVHDTE